MKPLAIDLCCGLGGWTEGLLAEGWDVIGFDVERHKYGEHQYPAQLVLQDILTLTGEQFRSKASLIVASPPCQKYSYMAMPWKRAKTLEAWHRDPTHPERIVKLNALFDACVRIGKEAQLPIIIENVRGAQPWVGRSRWSFGSFYLWGDVPALMPMTVAAPKVGGLDWKPPDDPRHRKGQAFNTSYKLPGFRFDGSGRSFQLASVEETGIKANHFDENTNPDLYRGNFGSTGKQNRTSSGSHARKASSAMIAKIPLPLSRHIAAVYR